MRITILKSISLLVVAFFIVSPSSIVAPCAKVEIFSQKQEVTLTSGPGQLPISYPAQLDYTLSTYQLTDGYLKRYEIIKAKGEGSDVLVGKVLWSYKNHKGTIKKYFGNESPSPIAAIPFNHQWQIKPHMGSYQAQEYLPAGEGVVAYRWLSSSVLRKKRMFVDELFPSLTGQKRRVLNHEETLFLSARQINEFQAERKEILLLGEGEGMELTSRSVTKRLPNPTPYGQCDPEPEHSLADFVEVFALEEISIEPPTTSPAKRKKRLEKEVKESLTVLLEKNKNGMTIDDHLPLILPLSHHISAMDPLGVHNWFRSQISHLTNHRQLWTLLQSIYQSRHRDEAVLRIFREEDSLTGIIAEIWSLADEVPESHISEVASVLEALANDAESGACADDLSIAFVGSTLPAKANSALKERILDVYKRLLNACWDTHSHELIRAARNFKVEEAYPVIVSKWAQALAPDQVRILKALSQTPGKEARSFLLTETKSPDPTLQLTAVLGLVGHRLNSRQWQKIWRQYLAQRQDANTKLRYAYLRILVTADLSDALFSEDKRNLLKAKLAHPMEACLVEANRKQVACLNQYISKNKQKYRNSGGN